MFESYSLFTAGEFVIPLELEEESPVLVTPPAVEVSPVLPNYRELQYVQSMVSKPNTLILSKLGSKGVLASPADAQAFHNMILYMQFGPSATMTAFPVPHLLKLDNVGNKLHDPTHMLFPIEEVFAQSIEDSVLWDHLQYEGFEVIATPSLAGWVPKAYRRAQRQKTPMLLPEVVDDRPLFERVDEGVVLRCIQTVTDSATFNPPAHSGYTYVIGDKKLGSESEGTEDTLTIHQLHGKSSLSARVITSSLVNGKFEDYFNVDESTEALYNPATCVPEVYAGLVAANRAKLDATGWQLYEHTKFDAAQAAVKRAYFNGKPMRMGKSREALAFLYLRGTKRNVFVCPKNVLPFITRELDILGISDYRVIGDYKDLEGPQPWMELISYNTLKKQKKEKSEVYGDSVKVCPHCGQNLEQLVQDAEGLPLWIASGGYLCRNRECTWEESAPEKGAAWSSEETIKHKGGYVDWLRKSVAKIPSHVPFQLHGPRVLVRQLDVGKTTMQVKIPMVTWTPPLSRRVRNRWRGAIFDEIHVMKDGSTATAAAALSLHNIRACSGLTGTLMPNSPAEAYWPMVRMFGRNNKQVPYKGPQAFAEDFVRTYTVTKSGDNSYRKRLPGLKNPRKFHELMAPVMIRRSYDDEMVKQSMEAAGMKVPQATPQPVLCDPDPVQAVLLVKSLEEFQLKWQEYQKQLEAKSVDKEAIQEINTSFIISQMSRMKKIATVPDYVNELAAKMGKPPIYNGKRGGGKMESIHNLCLTKCVNDEKVLVLSDYPQMRKLISQDLSEFNPILFDPAWNKDKRYEAFDRFEYDPSYKLFIAGPRSIGLGTDLAGGSLCNTCILVDLLWNPSTMLQAWSRILKPSSLDRTCEIYMTLLTNSLDLVIYNTFYAKMHAQELALDRKIVSKRAMTFDAVSFIQQVMASQDKLTQYLQQLGMQELLTLPELDMFQAGEERVA